MSQASVWAAEVARAEFGDARLNRRLGTVLGHWSQQPQASIPQASGSAAATKAAYRFVSHPAVTPAAIAAAARPSVVARIATQSADVVLSVQDTTELDTTARPTVQGVGPLSGRGHQGLHVHTALAVSATGVPLGVLAQTVWARDPATAGQRHQRRQRALRQKESARWGATLTASLVGIPTTTTVVTVADREADIFALFAQPRPAPAQLLIRATHDRALVSADPQVRYLWDLVVSAPTWLETAVRLEATPRRPARTAACVVQVQTVTLRPPAHRPPGSPAATPVVLQAVLVTEPAPPPDTEALGWLLLTSLPVATPEDALRIVTWYGYRWLIERYHVVLKTGCRIEERQFHTAERLTTALALYSLIACQLLRLTYQARATPDVPCTVVLTTAEWQALHAHTHHTPVVPATPPSLREALRAIARLGGFLGRRSDGEPGVQVLWQGLTRLRDLAAMWSLLHGDARTYG
jgi:hypothetical protein